VTFFQFKKGKKEKKKTKQEEWNYEIQNAKVILVSQTRKAVGSKFEYPPNKFELNQDEQEENFKTHNRLVSAEIVFVFFFLFFLIK
jgi:hypothetical protein